jgi:hypothetical protein
MKKIGERILTGATLLALLLANACNTVEPEKYEPTAIATSHNQSLFALGEAMLAVFQEDGYTPLTNTQTDFVFEKPGGAWSNIAYGTMMDPAVWMRVKIHLERVNSTTYRLEADLFRIRARGTSMEEKQHLKYGYTKEYTKLLEAVISKAGSQ